MNKKVSFIRSLLVAASIGFASSAFAGGGEELFVKSAVINADHTVTLPLYKGRSGARIVWYIVLDASTSEQADRYRVNRSNKLANARGSAAVQRVSVDRDGLIRFPASVDFSPARVVVPDPVTGFPPLAAQPGAVGEAGYSPLIELPDGSIVNAPQVANDSGLHDRIVSIDTQNGRVRMRLADGFSRDNALLYISTDSSSPVAAALEAATYAPALDAAPGLGDDSTASSRTSLAAFTNGQTGANNAQRQGLNSALKGDGDPLNLLAWMPNQGRYSPLWDVFLSTWAPNQAPTRQTEFAVVEALAQDGKVTAPDGGPWRATGFIVNCPIIKRLAN